VEKLGDALDRWESLGSELTTIFPDEIRLVSLKALVPKEIVSMMQSQVSLRTFAESLMYIRRIVADQMHAGQVRRLEKGTTQASDPMDVSTLLAAVAQIRKEWAETPPQSSEEEKPEDMSDMGIVLSALRGSKGKGKGKSKDKAPEDRECYNCGKVGHLARDCRSKPKDESGGDSYGKSGGKNKGKGKSKGKDWQVSALASGGGVSDEGIYLGCLTRAPHEAALNAVKFDKPEVWEDYYSEEAIVDSGAAICVCGPQHFSSVDTISDASRESAGQEYVCAGGGKIRNLGEKAVKGITFDGGNFACKFQVTMVDRVLLAVAMLTAAGHDVWFGKNHGVITNGVTGAQTVFPKKHGVYTMTIWVKKGAEALPPAGKLAGNATLPNAGKRAGNKQTTAGASWLSGGTGQ
jgi:hypothetical protein